MEEHCNYNSQKIIEQLIKCKINLLAIDFDNTFISIHTGGVVSQPYCIHFRLC